MILSDKYALFRDPFSGEPFAEPEMTTWDYALINAVQIIEDFTLPNGLLVWENESESIQVFAVQKVDKFEAAKEAYNKKNKKEVSGSYLVPKVKLAPFAEEYPQFSDWLEKQRD